MGAIEQGLIMKAVVALEEATQSSRYGPVEQTHALRFALAYLWSIKQGDRRPYDDFWRAMGRDVAWRYGIAERALVEICAQVGCPRNEEAEWALWKQKHMESLSRSSGQG